MIPTISINNLSPTRKNKKIIINYFNKQSLHYCYCSQLNLNQNIQKITQIDVYFYFHFMIILLLYISLYFFYSSTSTSISYFFSYFLNHPCFQFGLSSGFLSGILCSVVVSLALLMSAIHYSSYGVFYFFCDCLYLPLFHPYLQTHYFQLH